jgi:hypothetical protein
MQQRKAMSVWNTVGMGTYESIGFSAGKLSETPTGVWLPRSRQHYNKPIKSKTLYMPQMNVQMIASISNLAHNSTCGRVMTGTVKGGISSLASGKLSSVVPIFRVEV